MELRPFLAALMVVAVTQIGSAVAEDWGEGNARVRLLASAGRVQPGESVLLGVQFDIRPGWHIYWKNPGGAGLATGVDWRLPDGVEAGDLLWPVPVGFIQSGDIPGYGYGGSVVLAARLRSTNAVPATAVAGASVSWLACRDVCVLGSAELEGPWAEIEIDRRFADWEASLPRPLEGADAPFTLTAKGSLAEGKVGLWLKWRDSPRPVEWFPDPPDGLAVEDVTIQTRGGLTRIDAVVRVLAGSTAGPKKLGSLVVVTDSNQQRRGWKTAVDLMRNER